MTSQESKVGQIGLRHEFLQGYGTEKYFVSSFLVANTANFKRKKVDPQNFTLK